MLYLKREKEGEESDESKHRSTLLSVGDDRQRFASRVCGPARKAPQLDLAWPWQGHDRPFLPAHHLLDFNFFEFASLTAQSMLNPWEALWARPRCL